MAQVGEDVERELTLADPAFWRVAGPVGARQRLVEALRLELLGPEEPEEELVESPITRYLAGMLAPFGTDVDATEQDESSAPGDGDEDAGAADASPPLSQAMSPSSIGLSFLIAEESRDLRVAATWGDYVRLAPPEDDADEEPGSDPAPEVAERSESEPDGAPPSEPSPRRRAPRWKRAPRAPETFTITLRPGQGLQQVPLLADDNITIEHLSRQIGDQLAVSVFLVNRRSDNGKGRAPADRWIFQPELTIRPVGDEPAFLPRSLEGRRPTTDRDVDSNRLLYRAKLEFAVGHGCAAEWIRSGDSERASEIRSSLIPRFELPRVEPRVIEASGLDMEVLAGCESVEELRSLLQPLLGNYGAWIDEQQSRIETLPEELRSVAADHVDACRDASRRIEESLVLLERDANAFEAFRFANHAMLLQRAHTDWAAKRRKDRANAPLQPQSVGRWRPFQLAFILLNLPALIDPSRPDREIGDLLWFPTGGGKTEAYLGLAAFTLALRRRRETAGFRTDAGVTVLMRYTLRLLTVQQFQRAVAMVCACEVLRRRDPARWGAQRFSIGLWVGMRATPNTHTEARLGLTRLKAGERQVDKNPCQLESCPWCGTSLGYGDYWDDGDALRIRVACPDPACHFARRNASDGLPVVLVDEEIYRECPSMVISTVDKFAQMPWNGEIQSLFGRVERECSVCGFLTADSEHKGHGRGGSPETVSATAPLAPPELIIQDELHLISGPLGTLVGLYETAVDVLSTRIDGMTAVKPKLVASTATVRRAYEQVRAIFDRSLKVFPPPGLEPSDSFFALESPLSETSPGRLYVGVMAPGKSMKTAVVRVAAAIFSSAAGLAAEDAPIADPYMTMVLYFNSLRELGGAVRLMDDDIPARLRQLEERGLPPRFPPVYAELTSRVFSEQIPALLRQLEQPHDAPRAEGDPFPLDAVLASNMISVGVDVSRLGLMVVNGQPKMSSEYIQATGRVGRETWGPGLVVTIYNWTRPRDLSHYERFVHYHETFYRNVEAVSATPFSSRARDRGLAGAFVSAARLGSSTLAPETAADRFDAADPEIEAVIERFRSRAEAVSDAQTASQLEAQLVALGDEWAALAANPLRYGWRSPDPAKQPGSDVLLRSAEGGEWGHWDAPGSLREVEGQSRVYLLQADGA